MLAMRRSSADIEAERLPRLLTFTRWVKPTASWGHGRRGAREREKGTELFRHGSATARRGPSKGENQASGSKQFREFQDSR